MATSKSPPNPADSKLENSIGPSRRRRETRRGPREVDGQVSGRAEKTDAQGLAAKPDAKAKRSAAERKAARVVPEEVRQRFVQMKNKFYFADGARAFTDRGSRLSTPSENTEVIRSLVQIAQARGWNEIAVRGTERFRREAWHAAQLVGLGVHGYRPTEFEQARVVRARGRQRNETPEDRVEEERTRYGSKEARPRTHRDVDGPLLTGRLVDHGPSTYHYDPKAAMSYFVTIETRRGDRTIWGVDLERAFKESLTKPEPGEEIGLRTVRIDAVKIRQQTQDAAGQVVERDLETHRNRWVLEKRAFFESRLEAARAVRDPTLDAKQVARSHPELVGTLLQVKAAELAAKRIRDPQDRDLFVRRVRTALADSVARGEPLPPVRVRDRTLTPSRPARGAKAPERGDAPVR